jgi:acetyl-CoA acetyltransferase
MARTGVTDRDFAEVAARNRTAGANNPDALVRAAASVDELVRTPWVVAPLRTGYLAPTGDSAVCLVLAAEGKAEKMCERPAWIHGVDQRIELQTLGARDVSTSAGARLAATRALAMAGLASARDVEVVELTAATPAEELILRETLGLGRDGRPAVNPSGGPLCGHPLMMSGLIRLGETFRQLSGRAGAHAVSGARRAIAHAARATASSRTSSSSSAPKGDGREAAGRGRRRRPDASLLAPRRREHRRARARAVDRALLDAGLGYADIDAVVIGKAPDQLEGVMQPEQYLAGALGAHLKPLVRVHTAGSVGASTALTAVTHVGSGLFDRVLAVAWEKQSEGNAMWALSPNLPFTPPLVAGAGGFFAPYCRAYMTRTGCPPHIGPLVAVNARDNAGRNEYAHLREPMTLEDVMNSPVLWDPIRYLETCPSSDGAVAMILASEEHARKGRESPRGSNRATRTPRRCGSRPRPGEPARRPHARSACTSRRASATPGRRSRSRRCTSRSPGSSRCGSRTSASATWARDGASSTAASRSSAPTCP